MLKYIEIVNKFDTSIALCTRNTSLMQFVCTFFVKISLINIEEMVWNVDNLVLIR